jgi:hypothetical protein
LTGAKLDVVDNGTHGDVLQGESVAHFGSSVSAGEELVTHFQSIGSDDVTLFTVSVVKKSDASRTVRIVLDGLHHCGNSILLSLEIDETELALVATAEITHGHLTDVVATTAGTLTADERFFRY